jgi:hypothetical protein
LEILKAEGRKGKILAIPLVYVDEDYEVNTA